MYNNRIFILSQASELAEFTAKIALLEEAKKKKEDEATEWQHKVQHSSSLTSEMTWTRKQSSQPMHVVTDSVFVCVSIF